GFLRHLLLAQHSVQPGSRPLQREAEAFPEPPRVERLSRRGTLHAGKLTVGQRDQIVSRLPRELPRVVQEGPVGAVAQPGENQRKLRLVHSLLAHSQPSGDADEMR
ncbi:MAG: hypothetical protein II921_07715, partial [Treponema sp.]|nr:hypothetical protein [Treponema sp.]